MYHLITNLNKYIIVRDTDYKSTNWEDTVPVWSEKGSLHWNRDDNRGKPIEKTLREKQKLLASSASYAFRNDYPEFCI